MARARGEAFKGHLSVLHCGLGTTTAMCEEVAIGTACGVLVCRRHANLIQEIALESGEFWRPTPLKTKRQKAAKPERASKLTKKAG